MALVLADRVKETTTTTGTGTVTLAGVSAGYQSFAAIGDGNTTYYTISGQTTSEWEVGIGTYTSSGTTLSRTTVLSSSNGGSLVNFSAGTKDVFVTYPSGRSVNADAANTVVSVPQLSATSITDSGNLTFTGTGNRITGDFSNGTLTSRVAFQTSTANSSTNLHVLPSGTGTASGLKLEGDASMANGSRFTFDLVSGTDSRIGSGQYGTGTYLPMTFYTGGSERMRLDTSGNLGIGGTVSDAGTRLQILGTLPSNSGISRGFLLNATIPSTTTVNASGYMSGITTDNTAFTVTNIRHFYAGPGAKGAASTITNQYGFLAESTLTDATNNYGFYGAIGSGTGRYNLYMNGTADNYIAGNLGVGTSSPTVKLDITGNGSQISKFQNYAAPSGIDSYVAEGTSAAPTALLSGRQILNYRSYGYDGASYIFVGGIDMQAESAFSVGANPTYLRFRTSPSSGTGTERMRIDSNGNVGIGTSAPTVPLNVVSSTTTTAGSPSIILQGSSNTERLQIRSATAGGGQPVTALLSARGSIAAPTATLSGDPLGYYQLGGYNGTAYIRAAWVSGFADGDWSATNQGSSIIFSTTPNGSTTIAERMRIDSAGNIRLGDAAVATNTLRFFDIYNSDTGGSSGAIIRLVTSNVAASGNTTVDIVKYKAGGFILNNNDTNAAVFTAFGVGASERMRIDSSGDVGIGNSSPGGFRLNVTGSIYQSAGYATLGGYNAGTTGTSPVAGGISFSTNITNGQAEGDIWNGNDPASYANTGILFTQRLTSSTRRDLMFLHNNGNVGIGTNSPSDFGATGRVLQIQSTANNGYASLLVTSGGKTIEILVNNDAGVTNMGTRSNDVLGLVTNDLERMRIDTSGNVLVGTTSADAKFVVSEATNAVSARIATSLSTGCTVDIFQVTALSHAAGTGFHFARFYSSGPTVQFAVRGDGTVYAQNTTIQSLSDARVKENVRNSSDGLQTIIGLRPVRFDFKKGFGNDRKNQLGFIAQEVQTVFPDAVDISGESDESGDPYKSVGPAALIPVLVKAIQEQQALITSLTARITALEST
jgi:hypothetical protein